MKTYDATLKHLIDTFSPEWTPLLCERARLPTDCQANPLDGDLSIASNQADKLFRLSGSSRGLLHLELETSWAGGEALDNLLLYNVLAEHRYGGPVYSVMLLLRRQAWSPQITGVLERRGDDGRLLHAFYYTPVLLWDQPCEPLMQGPLGTLPLALLTDEAQPALPNLIARIDQRLQQEAPTPKIAGEIWTACDLLLGLRYDRATVAPLFQGARAMRDSSTYQAILAEGRGEGRALGRIETLQEILRWQGQQRFGPLRPEDETVLSSITDPARLGRMAERVLQAADWNELLGTL